MKKHEIVARVKSLGLPLGSYIVYGSGPLAVADLREAKDIDMLVSDEVLYDLKQAGWQQIDKGVDDKPYTLDVFEAHSNWNFSPYSPTLQHLLASATMLDGVPFAALEEVRKWKVASGRPKDFKDVALIDAYVNEHRQS